MKSKHGRAHGTGDRVSTLIGDTTYIGTVVRLSVFGPLNPKDYVAVKSDDGKTHLGLRRFTIPLDKPPSGA